MSEIGKLCAGEVAFLEPYLPKNSLRSSTSENLTSDLQDRGLENGELPFVTLTYACSLDSKIALAPGARTTLSGPETKTMTHYLRLRHDAILIGVGTATVDNPSLNCRYPGIELEDQPRPVIIDPSNRWEITESKVIRLAESGEGKAPWIISNTQPQSIEPLSRVGGDYIVIDSNTAGSIRTQTARPSSRLPWIQILHELKRHGVRSVMIEGGATIINDLLEMPYLVDAMIITIAPTFLGQGGVTVSPPSKMANSTPTNAAWLQNTKWRQFGNDVVLCGKLRDS